LICLPAHAARAIARLEHAGYETWAVGGCVRDGLMGRMPHDWDLCSAARPEQMKSVFADERVLDVGLRHGTLTVLTDDGPLEITTFRADGGYSDGRHPDSVRFVGSIEDDLARRDFTIGAMAWHPQRGLCDPYGGLDDLQDGILRAVGEPDARFREDALRILRGVRFAAQLGFTVEPQTAAAMRRQQALLSRIAAERVREELTGMLCGRFVQRALRDYADVLFAVLPELCPMYGCAQQNPHHLYDVWEHSLYTVGQVPAEPVLRWAALLHDCGKPCCKTVDASAVGHFYGHPAAGCALAEQLLRRLRFSNEQAAHILFLVEQHDRPLGENDKLLRRQLAKMGETRFRWLLSLKKGDAVGQGTHPAYIAELCETEARLNAVLEEDACLSLKQLAVDGRDMMTLGLRGPAVGEMLQALLEAVLDRQTANTRQALLELAKTRMEELK
jgi:tRNA nucleotidyltransferase (CCA-adding enzyme)